MKFKKLILIALTGVFLTGSTVSAQVTYEHVRNATGRLSYNDTIFVIDPMFIVARLSRPKSINF